MQTFHQISPENHQQRQLILAQKLGHLYDFGTLKSTKLTIELTGGARPVIRSFL